MLSFMKSMLKFLLGQPRSPSCRSDHPSCKLLSRINHLESELSGRTLVVDVEGGLLRSSSTFPYFMLVALEAGGFLRGLFLLLLYPLLCCMGQELGLRVMVMVSFCGIRKEGFRAGRAVLPKFLMEDVGLEGFEILRRAGRRVCASSMPRVMVEGFLKEYLEVEVVFGRELKELGGFYTGLMEEENKMEELGFEKEKWAGSLIGMSCSTMPPQHPLLTQCKEIFLVAEAEKRSWQALPRHKYPRPLVFHDGRIAFRPSPLNTMAMFLWLPLGFPLAILRSIVSILIPYKSTPIVALTGMKWSIKGTNSSTPHIKKGPSRKGHLFVCNHRTLIDPVYVSIALGSPVTAVTYSVSRVTEIMAPIKTVRLTRNKDEDGRKIEKLLNKGELVVVCPEGTTCREPYLLRFSPLFTELCDEIIPVAINVRVSMFYATTAGGLKSLDVLFYLMNPYMCYELQFLESVDTRSLRVGDRSSIDIANHVQGVIGRALGFECTKLTRKDKYLMLAGNDGIVAATDKSLNKNTTGRDVSGDISKLMR